MFSLPHSPTVSHMFDHAAVPEVRARAESLHRRCFVCSHSEFVHADDTPRWCLYSECACSSYTTDLASIRVKHDDRVVA